MHPSVHAVSTPDKPAIIMARTGQQLSYAGLEALSNRCAHGLRTIGLKRGDTVAICLPNVIEFIPLVWAAHRAGLRYVCISSRLTRDELTYILHDSAARALIISPAVETGRDNTVSDVPDTRIYTLGGPISDLPDFESVCADQPATPLPDQSAGTEMLYSSGTTGRPKGIALPFETDDILQPDALTMMAAGLFGINDQSVYLSPAPLYHAAPLRWTMAVHRLGGTAIIMESFDAELALASIQKYRVTAGQFVPTHFVRMLKLPEEVRAAYDVTSIQLAIHAAAPCPVPVKEAMIEWWGPVLTEYYAGTEGNGLTMISSAEWLTHKGSVGRSVLGQARICDENGEELPVGEVGQIYFSDGRAFAYHNDPDKTSETMNRHGWTSLGDIGRLDEEGYLYLTDRKSFTIISGGVNIYPQEIENLLIQHPAVTDVAVVSAPCPEMGEQVVAVIQPAHWSDSEEIQSLLAEELRQWTRARLSGVKTPRRFDFMPQLPRHDTGKLYKRLLRDRYWSSSI
ncbi:acyl-CoA synthetase [uncultured Brevundimonas sp.]|uniref:acyl-CoA synthetase n=1 Tax=uncultured Brevundimonas sp. TaxID=213418 RepID=UPI0026395B62|nr:acyl-CoA synthetase [uncultured Brevundimonas sp.]